MPAAVSDKAEDEGIPAPRRHIAFAAILVGVAMSVIDASSVNVVLPRIAQDFNVQPADAIRIVSAHQIMMVAMLLPCASLAEKIGFRRMLMLGLFLFVVASVGCALASTLPELFAMRIVVGVSGACMFSSTTALVRLSQPTQMLGRTMGMVATVVAVSTGLGPAIATTILVYADWTWIFVPNVVFGLLALALCPSLPVVRDAARPINVVSAGLAAATISLLIVGVGKAAETPALAGCCVLLGSVLGAVLLRRERKTRFPILPVDLLRIPQFSISVAGAACLFLAQMSAFVALPFRLHAHFDSVHVGMLLTVWPIAVALTAPWAGRLSDYMRANVLCAVGSALLGTGLLALIVFPSSSLLFTIPALILCGTGFGMFQTPNNRHMLLAVPLSRVGAAGGMQATTRQFGQAMGASAAALAFTLSATFGATLALAVGAAAACAALLISIAPRGDNA